MEEEIEDAGENESEECFNERIPERNNYLHELID